MGLATSQRFSWAGGLLGFGLGGFFDGIVLHQVLQWHHLLSAVGGEGLRDIRVQILADGLFHVLMYVIVAAALWMLWRSHRHGRPEGHLLADTLIGFGVWQLVDIVLFHWILGIHHIRMATENPVAWDVGWFVVFGVPALIAGALLRRGGIGGGGIASRTVVQLGLAVTVLAAGGWAALPPRDAPAMMVMFGPSAEPASSLRALAAADATVMWMDPTGAVAAVAADDKMRPSRLYAAGAFLVSRTGAPAGCFTWSRA